MTSKKHFATEKRFLAGLLLAARDCRHNRTGIRDERDAALAQIENCAIAGDLIGVEIACRYYLDVVVGVVSGDVATYRPAREPENMLVWAALNQCKRVVKIGNRLGKRNSANITAA